MVTTTELKSYKINAFWDAESEVWVATSEDVQGFATEAETLEFLNSKLEKIIPELLILNGIITENYTGSIIIDLTTCGTPHLACDEIWYIPLTRQRFVVDNTIKYRHTANTVLK